MQQPLIRTDFADAAAASRQVGALGYTLGTALHPMVMTCSGVLLGPSTVLTAAHCIENWPELQKPDSRLALHFTLSRDIGQSNRNNSARVVAAVAHPGYAENQKAVVVDIPATKGQSEAGLLIERHCGKEVADLRHKAADAVAQNSVEAALLAEDAFYACYQALLRDHVPQAELAEHYLSSDGAGDIAILFLDRPIKTAKETALVFKDAQDNLHAHKDVLVIGYGRTSSGLQQESTATGSIDGFKQMGRMHVSALSPTEALVTSETTAICSGDSGGGVFSQQGPEYALIGISVRGAQLPLSGRCINPGAITRVAHYVPWIESVLADRPQTLGQSQASWWTLFPGLF